MNTTLIKNAEVVFPGDGVREADLLIQDGKIVAINPEAATIPTSCSEVDVDGCLLTPGLVDIHTHGIHKHLYEQAAVHLLLGSEILPSYGTTSVLPTLYTVMSRC